MATDFLPVPDWFFANVEGVGLAVSDLNGDGSPDLVVLAADAPPGQNRGVYRVGHDVGLDGSLRGGRFGDGCGGGNRASGVVA